MNTACQVARRNTSIGTPRSEPLGLNVMSNQEGIPERQISRLEQMDINTYSSRPLSLHAEKTYRKPSGNKG